jgi:hypothetical protein
LLSTRATTYDDSQTTDNRYSVKEAQVQMRDGREEERKAYLLGFGQVCEFPLGSLVCLTPRERVPVRRVVYLVDELFESCRDSQRLHRCLCGSGTGLCLIGEIHGLDMACSREAVVLTREDQPLFTYPASRTCATSLG